LQQLIERTEWLYDQVETLQQTIQEIQAQIQTQREVLAALACQGGEPSSSPAAWVTPEFAGEDATAATSGGPSRRSIPRRRGNPVPVLITSSQSPWETRKGWVIDRSPEGLCVVADDPETAGARLNLQPVQTLGNLHWFPVEVRNCRPERGIWILGCRFSQKLSWSDLRLCS